MEKTNKTLYEAPSVTVEEIKMESGILTVSNYNVYPYYEE